MGRTSLNLKGFSLTEALVGMAILGIMATAFASLIKNSNEALLRSSRKADLLDQKYEIGFHYQDAANCYADFQNISLNYTNLGSTATNQQADMSTGFTYLKNLSSNTLKPGYVEVTLKQKLQDKYYFGIASVGYVTANDQATNFKPVDIPIVFETNPTTNALVNCIGGLNIETAVAALQGNSQVSDAILGTCQEGFVMVGITENGVKCTEAQASASTPPPEGSSESPYSLSNPGPGCSGAYCSTSDFGPCYGAYCTTNGTFCDGVSCTANGEPSGRCKGDYCTARGPGGHCDGDYCTINGTGSCTGVGCTTN